MILLRGILLASQTLYRLNPPIRASKAKIVSDFATRHPIGQPDDVPLEPSTVDLPHGILLVIKLAFNYMLESLCWVDVTFLYQTEALLFFPFLCIFIKLCCCNFVDSLCKYVNSVDSLFLYKYILIRAPQLQCLCFELQLDKNTVSQRQEDFLAWMVSKLRRSFECWSGLGKLIFSWNRKQKMQNPYED